MCSYPCGPRDARWEASWEYTARYVLEFVEGLPLSLPRPSNSRKYQCFQNFDVYIDWVLAEIPSRYLWYCLGFGPYEERQKHVFEVPMLVAFCSQEVGNDPRQTRTAGDQTSNSCPKLNHGKTSWICPDMVFLSKHTHTLKDMEILVFPWGNI